MRYVQPFGVADAEASYIDGNPELGIEGSCVPAAALEHPQREILNVIKAAGLTPNPQDLTQLAQATQEIVTARMGVRPYTLPDGELHLYVRPDGNDDNDGLDNTASRAFATPDRAAQWVHERVFYGRGWITIHVADGVYPQKGGSYDFSTSFIEAVGNLYAAHLLDASCMETYRVRVVGNINNPSACVWQLRNDLQGTNIIGPVNLYGITFRVDKGASTIYRGRIAHVNSCCVTNCVFASSGYTSMDYGISTTAFRSCGSLTVSTANALTVSIVLNFGGSSAIGAYSSTASGVSRKLRCAVTIGGTWTATTACAAIGGDYTELLIGYDGSSSCTGAGVTGTRYMVYFPALLKTYGHGANFFPGTAAGVAGMPATLLV